MSELDNGWKTYRFDQMAEIISERVDPAEADTDIYVGLEHLEPEVLHIREWGHPSDVKGTKLRFYPGDIIFGRRRFYQRKLAVAQFEGICSAHAMVIRANPEVVLPEFLPFFMQSDLFYERMMRISTGSLSPTINQQPLKRQEFALPPLDEQRRIAEILWAADEAEEHFWTIVDRVRQLSRAKWTNEVFQANWKTTKIGEVATVGNGSTPSRKKPKYWQNGTYPWLPTGKVHERIIREADEYISQSAIDEWPMSIYPADSVLVAMIGQGKTRGSTAYLMIDAAINQNFACITPNGEISSWFLFYYLEYSYEELRHSSHGSNQEALNCQLIEQFPIHLPSSSEQDRLVKMMRANDNVAEQSIQHARQVAVLKKRLLEASLGNTP